MMKRTSAPTSSSDDELHRALEKAGCRFTRQRQAVWSYLRSVDMHPTAEQVFAAVRRHIPNISLATVYKALDALVVAGLAARLANDDGTSRYDGRSEPHYHLRCLQTGQVRDVPLPYDPQLLQRLAPELLNWLSSQGYELTGHRLELLVSKAVN